ncbi:DUF202 domain-containing protein [Nocardia uniformis]|uniref:DUF202 domain-containing protein n=1 Tax=Nocardia uniformis TaxID=53432 RepID=A0A849BRM6_9NOCA|nr:DUF202 domain-containing protein [Nocardia uniformis]NNH69273.1 DUF202 domain-containing protein [Nocardia uniformis]
MRVFVSSDTPAASDEEFAAPVDYRFTLANERTFLAWIRTSLGLLAGAVAVHALVAPVESGGALRVAVLVCLVLALVLALGAYRRWRMIERAMRVGGPLPTPGSVPFLAAGIAVVSLLAVTSVLLA